VLAAVKFATGMAEAGKHVDMAQMTAGIIRRHFIELSRKPRSKKRTCPFLEGSGPSGLACRGLVTDTLDNKPRSSIPVPKS
jgi:hypothetical protein